ncbi:EF0163 family protein [Enterococcus sp. LJL128]
MRKLVVGLVPFILVLTSGCERVNDKKTTESTEENAIILKKVDDYSSESNVEHSTTESQSLETTESLSNELDVKELLERFGEAYSNYSTIENRNEQLRNLMTKECAEVNGVNAKVDIHLSSTGSVSAIYKSEGGAGYALLLDCTQNGSEVRILLIVEIESEKVSKMTYNTVKQEY